MDSFNNEEIGRLYRFEHKHLRENFNPGHTLATPILPERKTFSMKNVRYQRTNFALSLAYALTAHKCQGETLNEVIVDFGADKENNIKNFICTGSFYVAITRVREGSKVFLRSFHNSYIAVNEKIEEKVNAMRKFDSYQMKKIYLNEQIFIMENDELKFGYLNINGLIDGNHAEYLNEDKNLLCLHVLVLAETKLDSSFKNSSLSKILSRWDIIGRYDAEDSSKHMGLLLMTPRIFSDKIRNEIKTITHQPAKRNNQLQIQGLIVRTSKSLTVGFIYCRSTPNMSEVKAIVKYFKECHALLGKKLI